MRCAVAISQHREFSCDEDSDETSFFPTSALPSIDERLRIEQLFAYNINNPLHDNFEHTATEQRHILVNSKRMMGAHTEMGTLFGMAMVMEMVLGMAMVSVLDRGGRGWG